MTADRSTVPNTARAAYDAAALAAHDAQNKARAAYNDAWAAYYADAASPASVAAWTAYNEAARASRVADAAADAAYAAFLATRADATDRSNVPALRCECDTYCPTPDDFASVDAFRAMCADVFGTAPALTPRNGGDEWIDPQGRIVLRRVS